MDITPGKFKDSYVSQSGKNSQNSQNTSRPLSQASTIYSSMEILPSEQINHKVGEQDSILPENKTESNRETTSAMSLTNVDILNNFKKSQSKSVKTLSSSLSDHSLASSSSDTECNENILDCFEGGHTYDQPKSQEEIDLEKAIKKMKKLDKVLMGKMKEEREVKRKRLLMQKSFYDDLEKLRSESSGGTYPDITNNTNKYLALMPPSQQLDVLLEQHQVVEDFEPIFQTQLYSNQSQSSFGEETKSKDHIDDLRPKSSEDKRNTSNEKESRVKKSKSSSADSKGKRSNQGDKINFIERNIQLAKDAGNLVAMTEEEKKRLKVLLEDDEEIESDDDDDNDPGLSRLIVPNYGEGYTPDQSEADHLHEIDNRLQTLLSPAVYSSISSTPLMNKRFHNTSDEMLKIGRKVAKSSVSQVLSPDQRLNEIEEKLSRLNEKWKDRFDFEPPRLSSDQLHRLLYECSRATSPDSITTSNLSQLDFRTHDDRFSPASFTSQNSTAHSSFEIRNDSRCSSRSPDNTLTSDADLTKTKPPVLEKDVLETLLREAKLSLGIQDHTETHDTEDHASAST